jgi:hypothetical protein
MLDRGNEPSRVLLEVGDRTHAAIAVALSGHRAAIRTKAPVATHDEVRLSIEWTGGATTSLRGVVAEVAGDPGCQPVTYIHLTAVEGDWRPFLSYAGAAALAG